MVSLVSNAFDVARNSPGESSMAKPYMCVITSTIAQLLALQMIVYIDETGWKVGDKSCYTWVFSTSMHVLYRCGVSRKKTEATDVLGESFGGIGVTDNRRDGVAKSNHFALQSSRREDNHGEGEIRASHRANG